MRCVDLFVTQPQRNDRQIDIRLKKMQCGGGESHEEIFCDASMKGVFLPLCVGPNAAFAEFPSA
jgi:hypothetical protein